RSSRCDRLAVGHAAVRTAPSPHSDRVAAPTAARKTAARLASSARINRPRNSLSSFISARKCWKCSLIGTIFAIGCRSPLQERLSLVRQSQLTPSRLLHNQRYVTIKRTAPCPGLPSMPFRYIRTVWTRRDSNPHLLTGQVNVLPLHHGPTPGMIYRSEA